MYETLRKYIEDSNNIVLVSAEADSIFSGINLLNS